MMRKTVTSFGLRAAAQQFVGLLELLGLLGFIGLLEFIEFIGFINGYELTPYYSLLTTYHSNGDRGTMSKVKGKRIE